MSQLQAMSQQSDIKIGFEGKVDIFLRNTNKKMCRRRRYIMSRGSGGKTSTHLAFLDILKPKI